MIRYTFPVQRPLELSIIYDCNLSCEGCSHFSDYAHSWRISLEEVSEWLRPWQFLEPTLFSVLGGEPTLHPDLCKILTTCRLFFPRVRFLFTTNAFFVHRHAELETLLREQNIDLKVAIHSDEPEYLRRVGRNLDMVRQWEKNGLPVIWANLQQDGWRKNYIGRGGGMKPFEDYNPRSSWESCPCRCYQIVAGAIWKCPQIAYLKMQYDRCRLSPEWDKYLTWQPLKAGSGFREVKEFFAREEEYICGMCPSKPNLIRRKSPLRGKNV